MWPLNPRPGSATLVLEVGPEAVDGECLPWVDTTHGVAQPGVFAGGFARSEWRGLAARAYRTRRACGGFLGPGPGAACLLVSSLLWGTVAISVLPEVPGAMFDVCRNFCGGSDTLVSFSLPLSLSVSFIV